MHEKPTIRRLGPADLKNGLELINLFNEVFEEAPSKNANLKNWLERSDLIALAAFDGNTLVGGLTAYVLPLFRKPEREAFIYDLAVKASHQRKGIGSALMQALVQHCKAQNIEYSFVPAEVEDEHAIAFYRKLGWEETAVAHFGTGID